MYHQTVIFVNPDALTKIKRLSERRILAAAFRFLRRRNEWRADPLKGLGGFAAVGGIGPYGKKGK